MTPSEIARALGGRKSGAGWSAKCPAHEDRTPSLSISQGRDGKILFRCHAGCTQEDVIAALKARGLWQERPSGKGTGGDFLIVAEYSYQNEKGEELFQCVRLEPKDFRQRHRQGDKWIWNLQGVRLVPYHLPQLLAAPLAHPVLIVEGEKDVHTAERLGFVATCNPMGAGKWKPDLYNSFFKGRRVVIVPDKDPPKEGKPAGWPGKQHAHFVARSLLSVAAAVQVLWLPATGKDLTDWVSAGGTAEQLRALIGACAPAKLSDLDDDEPHLPSPSQALAPILEIIEANDPARVPDLVSQLAEMIGSERYSAFAKLEEHFGKRIKLRDLKKAVVEATFERLRAKDPEYPQIYINHKYRREITEEAKEALRKRNDPPRLFQRSGQMVHITRDDEGRPSIQAINEHGLGGYLDRCANFLDRTRDGPRPASPPLDVVRDLMTRDPAEWPIPGILGIVEIPTLRPDGTMITAPGYDKATRLYYCPAPGLEIPEIPERPETGDIDAAKDCIDDAIGQFPFVDEASRANFYGLLLTPIMRPMFNGSPSGLALIDAPAAGTGKSLLVEVMALITTGRYAPMSPLPYRDEELEKVIFATLAAGGRLIVFDNLEGTLRSPKLAMALTSREYEGRPLGKSEKLLVPNLATWIATGNNIKPGGDITRRCFQIRLDAKMADPFRGRKFKHPKLLEFVLRRRGEFLHALLVLAKAWCAAGRKPAVDTPLGSFEEWHQSVGSTLYHAGMPDFMGNMDTFLQQADESNAQWERFLEVLHDHFRHEEAFTVSDFLERKENSAPLKDAIPDSLADAMARKQGSERQAIGIAFGKYRDRRFGSLGHRIMRGPDEGHRKIATWKVAVDPVLLPGTEVSRETT